MGLNAWPANKPVFSNSRRADDWHWGGYRSDAFVVTFHSPEGASNSFGQLGNSSPFSPPIDDVDGDSVYLLFNLRVWRRAAASLATVAHSSLSDEKAIQSTLKKAVKTD
jgi:hypothetical protein